MFITGFNAYQRKDYKSAVQTMSSLLKKYPETPLKDMAIFWLARANYRAGNKNEAAKYMAQFFRDYPDNPLKGTVEEELVQLAENYGAGQKPAAGAAVAQKAPAETVASEKVVPEQAGAEESAATEKAAADKLAAEKLAAEKLAAEKLAADKAAAERAATAKAAAEKAEADRLAAEKAAAEKMAAERAAAERMAAEKSAQDKAAAEKAAAEKAAAERVAQEKASAERAAAEKAAADRAAAERLAAEKAAAEKLAAEKALAEKAAADKAAAEKAAAERGAEQEKIAMRNKAIDAYKGVVDKFPGSAAAANATAKLRQLGIEYPAPKQMAATRPAETSQVFNLEVAQYANLDVRVGPVPETEEAGKQFIIPIDVVNTGNGNDSFYLESGFPRDFDFHFAAPGTPDIPINTTPTLANGEKFRMVAVGTIPRSNIDGQRNTYPIKIVSSFAHEASQSREIELATSAPLLRAVVKTDKPKLVPGEKVSYRISLLNIGTAPARGVTMRVNYPPQYEPVGAVASGFKQESKAALVLDSVQLKSGESKDFNLAFQLKDEALADQELFLRADVINNDLEKRDSFVSATSVVQKVSGVAVRTTAGKLVVIPGQVVAVPLIVTNTGNSREVFAIKANVGGGATYTFFDDLNRDGKRQANEPIINHVGPLSPKEEAYVVLEIATPASANDGQVASASVSFEPENAPERVASTDVQLTFSRPILELSMAAKGGRLKPGEVSSLDLNCVNRGTNMAKQVTLESVLPNQLELVAADPAFTRADNGVYSWRFDELGAGETRSIKVTYRVKPGTAVGTNMQLKNLLNYQDQIGNRY
ncbi:tetratricopeptide repeat protein [Geomonas sp. Red32]|uniref:tetratricopeptide repeat protein n=1 Tax=Geomonas sp. Red32 TaxID=2912856 RepID=UPI00202CBFA2|nr:tetratricopeptide repeat protein [Geomonas sp. Red32]MCM0080022.1 tetratricopeptide repeat protein [Geomonas sp. Red32]